jgi:hypothetical protein
MMIAERTSNPTVREYPSETEKQTFEYKECTHERRTNEQNSTLLLHLEVCRDCGEITRTMEMK